jgi:hypothetical protein
MSLVISVKHRYAQYMKRFWAMFAILSSCLLLTSCIKMDVNLIINKDATVSGTMVFAVADSLAEMTGDSSNGSNLLEDSVNTTAKGVTESEYKSGGYTGKKYTFDRVPFEEFNKDNSSSPDTLKFIKNGNQLTVEGVLDLSNTDSQNTDSSLGSWGDDIAKSISSSFDMNIAVKFPVKVLKSTGKISDDGMTVTWKPKYGDKVDLTTTVELPSGFQLIYIVVGLGLLGVAILIFVILRKGRKKNTEEITAHI